MGNFRDQGGCRRGLRLACVFFPGGSIREGNRGKETMVVATINVWNRLAAAFRAVPEGYQRLTSGAR